VKPHLLRQLGPRWEEALCQELRCSPRGDGQPLIQSRQRRVVLYQTVLQQHSMKFLTAGFVETMWMQCK
jgi:hypothetical protein